MSWILRNKIKLAIVALGIIAIVLLFVKLWVVSIILFITIIFVVLNKIVVKKANKERINFSANREIRTVNAMVIGDVCSEKLLSSITNKDKTLYLTCPGRSLNASFQILLHTVSRIDSDGHVVIVDGGSTKFTAFDTIWLNSITLKELGLETLSKRIKLPLIYHPLISTLILTGYKTDKYITDECPDKEIINFCKGKQLKLTYLVKK